MSFSSRARAAWQKARSQVIVTRTGRSISVALFNEHVITEAGSHCHIVTGPDGRTVIWTAAGSGHEPGPDDMDGTDEAAPESRDCGDLEAGV